MADNTTNFSPQEVATGIPAGAQPQPTGPNPMSPDLMTLFAQRIAQGDQAIQNQRDIAAKMAAVPQAPVGFHPQFGGGILHDIGQALLAAGAATRPGQAIMDVAQAPAQARRAQTLASLKAQMGPEEEATKFNTAAAEGAGRLGYEEGLLYNKNRQTDINQQKADTQAKLAANRSADMLVREAQGWKNLDVKQQANNIRAAFDREVINVARERVAAGQDENSARIQAQEDVKAAASQNQYSVLHPFLSMLGVTPDLSAAPGAQQPKKINSPAPPKPSKPSGKGQHMYFDAQGNVVNK